MSFNMSSMQNALTTVETEALKAYLAQEAAIASGVAVPLGQVLKDPRKKGGKFRRNSHKRRASKRRKSRKYRRRL